MLLSTIVIGDEILLGQVTDTNSGAIARTFGPDGWVVKSVQTVGDSASDIRNAVQTALATSQLVIMTGGLGPTKDDITKQVLADIFGGPMIMDASVTENIHRVFNRRGLTMNRLTELQAMVPASCRVIQNLLGTAPIMWFEQNGSVLVAMPGVPFETEGMLPEVHRLVCEHFTPSTLALHHSLMVAGITESGLAEKLDAYERQLPPQMHLAYLPTPGLIRLRLDCIGSKSDALASEFEIQLGRLRSELGSLMIYDGDATAAEILLKLLIDKGLTVSTAESCTGGAIASAITSIAGSSAAMLGGVVSYANSVKAGLLGVSESDLDTHGAVSQPVVEQMALGACRATGARCAMATSGIAGPGGGSAEKPVGTVWMAWAVDGQVQSRCLHLPGNRRRVIDRAVTEALLGLIKIINHE